MLNKSKTFKFLIGTFAFALALVATTVLAADYGTTVLKVGSKGEAVKSVQILVGATPVDGVFGPMTAAKVKVWQAANGLTADGVFGAASRAKAAGVVVTVPTGSFPAGCTSAAGFSSTTGMSCATVSTLPAGCTSATGFSSTTGASCSAVVTLPAGCSSTAGFSTTTGASCAGTTTSSALTGGAGDITLTPISTDVEKSVSEGTKDVKVLGFKVEATDSDVKLTNVKVSLLNIDDTGSGSPAVLSSSRLDKYATEVSVWMGSTKVGSALVSDFTKNGTTYSKSIALTDAVVKMGSSHKATFYVTVTANSSIDSINMETADWSILADNIRFQDSTGVIMTSSDTVPALGSGESITDGNTHFAFSTLANSGDVKVAVTKGSATPVAQNVKVSDTGSTKDVLMLEFKVKATGSDVTFDTVNVKPTVSGSAISDIVGELQLRNGSDTLATIDGNSLTSGSNNPFALDTTFTVAKDTTETFRVYATINDWDNFKADGGSLVVSLPSSTGMNPEDSNGDVVAETGAAAGAVQTFYSEGITASNFTSSVVASIDTGKTVKQTYTISFKIAANGADYYVDKTSLVEAALTDAGATAGAKVSMSASSISSTADLTTGYYLVADGSTETFTVTVALSSGTTTGFYHVRLSSLDYATDASGADTTTYNFVPTTSYETADAEVDQAA